MKITFRPLRRTDIPRLADWQSRPHVALWWREEVDLASLTESYERCLTGEDPTEVFIIEVDGQAAGLVQRYLMSDYLDWVAAIGFAGAAGIDYYLGEERLTGKGIGSQAVRLFALDTLHRYEDVPVVVAAPQQANVASWRALEKAGFERLWSGQPDSDDPSDSGPAYVYGLARDAPSNVVRGDALDGTPPRRGTTGR